MEKTPPAQQKEVVKLSSSNAWIRVASYGVCACEDRKWNCSSPSQEANGWFLSKSWNLMRELTRRFEDPPLFFQAHLSGTRQVILQFLQTRMEWLRESFCDFVEILYLVWNNFFKPNGAVKLILLLVSCMHNKLYMPNTYNVLIAIIVIVIMIIMTIMLIIISCVSIMRILITIIIIIIIISIYWLLPALFVLLRLLPSLLLFLVSTRKATCYPAKKFKQTITILLLLRLLPFYEAYYY